MDHTSGKTMSLMTVSYYVCLRDSVSMTTVSLAAQQQGETEKKLQCLKVEVERRDHDIRLLQTHLKDAEDILVG